MIGNSPHWSSSSSDASHLDSLGKKSLSLTSLFSKMKAWQRLGRKFRAFGIASLGGSSLIALRTYRFSVIADDQNKNSTPLRIAIIGSGVGGASTAYFLRESLNQKCPKRPVTMDVFEKNDYAGGRVYGVNLEAYSGGMLMKDVGATIIIKENQYMMHFGKDLLNLEMVNENDMEDKKGVVNLHILEYQKPFYMAYSVCSPM